MTEPQDTVQGKIGLAFANSLATGDYQTAYNMLSAELRQSLSPSRLKWEYEDMIEYIDSPLESVAVVDVFEDWPAKKDNDIGFAYAEFVFDGKAEAVAVVVTQETGKYVIREIEWGRP